MLREQSRSQKQRMKRTATCILRCLPFRRVEAQKRQPLPIGGGRKYRDEDDEDDEFEVIEVTERSESLSDWRLPDGSVPTLASLPFAEYEVSPQGALDGIPPDEQSFEEANR